MANEFPLGLPEQLPEPEMTPSPVALDGDIDNFLGFQYRLDVEALNDWANVTQFTKGSIEFEVEEPDLTDNLKEFFVFIYVQRWEKKY